jgi:hypothetical protein
MHCYWYRYSETYVLSCVGLKRKPIFFHFREKRKASQKINKVSRNIFVFATVFAKIFRFLEGSCENFRFRDKFLKKLYQNYF